MLDKNEVEDVLPPHHYLFIHCINQVLQMELEVGDTMALIPHFSLVL